MLDISAMTKNLREVSGQDENDLPDNSTDTKTGALVYLNKSYWKILDEFKFKQKERTTFFSTVIGTEAYQLPVLYEAVQHLAIVDSYDKRIPLLPLTRIVFDTNYHVEVDYQAMPRGYIRERDSIRLQPIPDAVYTIFLNYWTTLSDLASGNTAPEIPRSWHEVIELGAKYRVLADLGDRSGAAFFKQLYEREIATLTPQEAKEKADHSYSGLEVLGRDYDQRDPRDF